MDFLLVQFHFTTSQDKPVKFNFNKNNRKVKVMEIQFTNFTSAEIMNLSIMLIDESIRSFLDKLNVKDSEMNKKIKEIINEDKIKIID